MFSCRRYTGHLISSFIRYSCRSFNLFPCCVSCSFTLYQYRTYPPHTGRTTQIMTQRNADIHDSNLSVLGHWSPIVPPRCVAPDPSEPRPYADRYHIRLCKHLFFLLRQPSVSESALLPLFSLIIQLASCQYFVKTAGKWSSSSDFHSHSPSLRPLTLWTWADKQRNGMLRDL